MVYKIKAILSGLLLIVCGAVQAQNSLYLDSPSVDAGDTATLRLSLKNDQPVRSVQFDLVPVPGADLTFLEVKGLSAVSGWTVARALRKDTLRVMLYKLSTEAIAPGDTALFALEYAVKDGAYSKRVQFRLMGINLVDVQAQPLPALGVNGALRIDGVPPIPGDSDGNGKADVFDLLFLLRALSSQRDDSGGLNDFNADGRIDVFDLLALLNVLSHK
ncbi:hypothetical protein LLH00_13760 [bacterium]|nr:hypothetical protein [bacterium]